MEHYMNPAYGAMMEGAKSPDKQGEGGAAKREEHKRVGHAKHPHVAIHSHAGGHHVHITHPDGTTEHHHHELGDADGIAQHIHTHFGGGEGSAPEGHEAVGEEMLAGER